MKVVINTGSLDGLALSQEAFALLAELGMSTTKYKDADGDDLVLKNPNADLCFDRQQGWSGRNWVTHLDPTWAWAKNENDPRVRSDPRLVRAIEALGAEAAAQPAYPGASQPEFKIVTVPDAVNWHIATYEERNAERVVEDHRTW